MTQVRIVLIETLYNHRLNVTLPGEVTLGQLLPALVRKLKLPDGEYYLIIDDANAVIPPQASLSAAGILDGTILRLETSSYRIPTGQRKPSPPQPLLINIRITLLDPANQRKLVLSLPANVAIRELLPALVRKLNLLPVQDALRTGRAYCLVAEQIDMILPDELTLATAGIIDGGILRIEINEDARNIAAQDTCARLIMQTGPIPGQVFLLDKPEISIGRSSKNDITIKDAEVSRNHALLTIHDHVFVLEDLQSTNGTFVNERRLTTPQALYPGAMIRLGRSVHLVLEIPTAS